MGLYSFDPSSDCSLSKLKTGHSVHGIRETGMEQQTAAALSLIQMKDGQSNKVAGVTETPVDHLDLQPATSVGLGK